MASLHEPQLQLIPQPETATTRLFWLRWTSCTWTPQRLLQTNGQAVLLTYHSIGRTWQCGSYQAKRCISLGRQLDASDVPIDLNSTQAAVSMATLQGDSRHKQ